MTPNTHLSTEKFVEKFESILMPLEQNVVTYYQKVPTALDHEILSMYQYFSKVIKAKMTNFALSSPNVSGSLETLYHAEANLIESASKNISLEDLKACLKLLEKSVEMWNRQSGVQGYLNFISEMVPVEEQDSTSE